LYQLAVLLHLLAAIIWIGGTLFLVIVIVPLTRSGAIPRPQAVVLLRLMGRRFRPVAWAAIGVLVVTGIYLAWDHWNISPSTLLTGSGTFVETLRAKVGLVGLAIVLSAVHDFVLGPRVSALSEAAATGGPPSPALLAARRRLVMLARVNLAIIAAILVVAVMLGRGWPF
jgi:copper resistance protein D